MRVLIIGALALAVTACERSGHAQRPVAESPAPASSKETPVPPSGAAVPPSGPPAPSVEISTHAWKLETAATSLSDRIAAPEGFSRQKYQASGFGKWLRGLPIRPGRPQVKLHTGQLKGNQSAQHVVLDIDTGRRDLQQCADAVMRLRAEYQWSASKKADICFRFTSGDKARWSKWQEGFRPKIRGNKVSWAKSAKRSGTYRTFRKYLDKVFTYAGTYSLSKETKKVRDPTKVEIGDFFVQGGFPGHAMIVVDVVQNDAGQRMFLLAQSYMPAQDIHVVRNPASQSPWYMAKASGTLDTPEWRFNFTDLHRFDKAGCAR